MKTTIQKLHGKGLFDNYDTADEVLKDYLPGREVNDRRRTDFNELKNDIQ